MATTKSVSGLVTIEEVFLFGGPSGKKRKMATVTFTDAANGIEVGGDTNTLLVSELGLNMTKVFSCSNLNVYTTSGAATARAYVAVPSQDGARINFVNSENGTDADRANPADLIIATTETGRITVIGY